MTDRGLGDRYAFAVELIRDAGDLAHGYFKNRDALTIKSKGLQDMASEADLNTELLIRSRLETAGIKLTRLARGLPVGGDLEFADQVTLGRALQGRQSF